MIFSYRMQPLVSPTPVGWYQGSIGFAITFTRIHYAIIHWEGRQEQCRMWHILFSTQFCPVTFIFNICKYSVGHVEDLTLAKRISGGFHMQRFYSRPSGISHINLFRQTKYFLLFVIPYDPWGSPSTHIDMYYIDFLFWMSFYIDITHICMYVHMYKW